MSSPHLKNGRLSVDELRAILAYEPETGILRWKTRPNAHASFNTKYAGKPAGTLKKGAVQVAIFLSGRYEFFLGHRLAWAIHYGEWPEFILDHEDGDATNNRIGNLRAADGSENGCNKHEIRGAVPFKGVYYVARLGKFAAQIKHRGRWSWLGLHDTGEQAAVAYDTAAESLHGEFARTNADIGALPNVG